jgi:hypothetical protein
VHQASSMREEELKKTTMNNKKIAGGRATIE